VEPVVEFIKAYLIPGSFPFLMIAATVGALGLFLRDRWAGWSRRGLVGLLAGYWVLSLPACASRLEMSLARPYAPLEASQARDAGIRTIVILGGGIETYRDGQQALFALSDSTALRVLEGARLYGLIGDPWVIASGGGEGGSLAENGRIPESQAMRQALVSLGVPSARIKLESSSTNTRDEAVNVKAMLGENPSEPLVLVTSPTHMRRALASFRAVGLEPIPSVSAQQTSASGGGLRALLPSPDALTDSTIVLREYLALAYYGLRSWMSVP
jgi:uncharacterized SAM-binding protein YcdF (DUF218 family)